MTTAGSIRRRGAIAAAFAALALGVIALVALIPASAGAGGGGGEELGKTAKTPPPSCPSPPGNSFPARKACQALGKVTGFQRRADGKAGLFKVPSDGTIVGWSVDLAKPDRKEREFFAEVLGDEAIGGDPTARLALLSAADGRKYRLREQSPRINLSSLLGQRQYFTLNDPIAVRKNWVVALTTPTWIPNFAHDFGGDDRWRASRGKERCEGKKNLEDRSKPHSDVGSTRAFACNYSDARLLYWAYFVAA